MPDEALSPAHLAEQLKQAADRVLNVDGRRALALADQICAIEAGPSVRALGLLTRGDALRELGRHAEAVEAYEHAAALYLSVDDQVGWARTRVGVLVALRYTGASHAGVLKDVRQARRILSRHGMWVRLARLEKNSGVLLAALGRSRQALAAHKRARRAAERLAIRDDLLEAEIQFETSIAYYQADDHERAEALLREAVSTFDREGQLEWVSRARRNFARYAAGRGQYSKALAFVLPGRRALLEAERTDAAAHFGQVGVDCLIRLNRPAEAANLAREVATEFESIGSRIEAASTHRLRSLALAQLGRTEDALGALARAQELYGSAKWESGPAHVHLGRAVMLGEVGAWQQALAQASSLVEELKHRRLIGAAAQAELVRGRALRHLGQPAAARAAARRSLALAQQRRLPWLAYHAWRLLGDIALDQSDAPRALSAFLKAINYLEQVQGRILTEYRASFLADKADLYEAAVDLLDRSGQPDRAFELAERAKSRALVDALAGGLDIRIRATTPDQVALLEELNWLRRRHDALLETSEAGPELAHVESRIGEILEELRLTGAGDLEPLSLLQARLYSPQAQLGVATALLEYYVVGTDLLVFLMDTRRLQLTRLTGALPGIEELQRRLDLNLRAAASTPDARARLAPSANATLARLYDALIQPLAASLGQYERLVIVPHGQLHRLPFAALRCSAGYLAQRFEVVSAPSASSLSFCLRPRARRGQHVLIGAHSAGGALPGARGEAEAVSAIMSGVQLLEEELTIAALRKAAPAADMIHLAAHGMSRPEAPLFSYVRLADGHLTALDCFELELECALVTLSACESGRGHIAPGDEQIGLARAFLYAGARAVLHSLWRIDDRATQQLMTEFYRGLYDGLGRGAALRRAQLTLLDSGAEHPLLWAAFVLIGDWRREGD